MKRQLSDYIPVIIAALAVVITLVCIMLAVSLDYQPAAAPVADTAVVGAEIVGWQVGDALPETNTPRPSHTAQPTRTPFPTFSPTVAPTDRPRVQVEYIEVPVITERVIIITATPEPTTDTPPTGTPTPDAHATQAAFDQQILNSQARRNDFIMWVIVGLLAGILVMLLLNAFVNTAKSWVPRIKLPSLQDTTITPDDLRPEEKFTPTARHPLSDIPIAKRREIRYRRAQGQSQREIEQAVFNHQGGDAYEKVKRVLEYYDNYPTTPPPAPTASE